MGFWDTLFGVTAGNVLSGGITKKELEEVLEKRDLQKIYDSADATFKEAEEKIKEVNSYLNSDKRFFNQRDFLKECIVSAKETVDFSKRHHTSYIIKAESHLKELEDELKEIELIIEERSKK